MRFNRCTHRHARACFFIFGISSHASTRLHDTLRSTLLLVLSEFLPNKAALTRCGGGAPAPTSTPSSKHADILRFGARGAWSCIRRSPFLTHSIVFLALTLDMYSLVPPSRRVCFSDVEPRRACFSHLALNGPSLLSTATSVPGGPGQGVIP